MITIELDEEIPAGAISAVEVDGKRNVYFSGEGDIDTTIDPSKSYAKLKIKIDCEKCILEPVESEIAGILLTMRNEVIDQMNLLAAIVAGVDTTITDEDGKKIKIKVKDAEELHLQMVTKKENLLTDKTARIAEIEAATTEEEIELVIDRAW